jgi:transposase
MNTEEGKKALDIMLDALEDLRKRMLDNTRALRRLSNDKRLEGQMDLITSVPGVGQVLGMTLLLEIGEFKRFKNAESLASYIGLVPMCHNSGEHIGSGDITVRKHSSLRTMLVEAAWVAIRQDPAMTLAYENLYKRMKPSKAIIIIARKMVNRIYHVMKYSEKYALNVVS